MNQSKMSILELQQKCIDLVTRFYWFLDRGEFKSMMSLLTPDCMWLRPGGVWVQPGPDLLTLLDKRVPGTALVHVLSNMAADKLDDETVHLFGYMTVFMHVGHDDGQVAPLTGPKSIRALNIKLNRHDTLWRIARIENSLLFETR